MTVTIKPYADSDYEEVWALHQRTIQENDGFVKELAFHSDFQNITAVYDGFFVLRAGGELAGMVGIKSDGEIKRLQVAPAHQGFGYGRRLMDHVIDYAKSKGMARVHLDVSEPNKEAYKLYLKMGFTITGTKKNVEYGTKGEAFDMTYMEKILNPALNTTARHSGPVLKDGPG